MTTKTSMSRRGFLLLTGAVAAGGLTSCASGYGSPSRTIIYRPGFEPSGAFPGAAPYGGYSGYGPDPATIYAGIEDDGVFIPPVPYERIDPKFYRQRVQDPTGEPAGTVVVDTARRFLYVVEAGGTAMRYGVGIGRQGFEWQGEGVIQWRRKWPRWTPPDTMIARKPELARYSADNGGMDPGLDNPLGARALYIFQNGEDTLYRLHGSPEWQSIGTAASSGCVRLINQDVIDLYTRVPNKARIVVWQ